MVMARNDQELVESEPKSSPRNQSGKQPKLQINIIQRGHKINRMNSFFPKRCPLSYLSLSEYHLDPQNVKTVQKLTTKQATQRTKSENTALERSVIQNDLGTFKSRLNGYPTPPSAFEVVQNI